MFARIRRAEDGFTLVELLIVIVILGILAGVAVFGVAALTGDSAKSACKADMKTVETAAQAFKAKTGAYPTGASPIQILVDDDYLKNLPGNSGYTVTLASGTGVVTGVLDEPVDGSTDCTAAA